MSPYSDAADFLARAQPLSLTVDGEPVQAEPVELSPSGFGWVARGTVACDGERLPVELRLAVCAVGPADLRSAALPTDGLEELLSRMATAPVVRARFNKGGSSISMQIDLSGRLRVSFKPTQINPQTSPLKEVAAYRLSRLLCVGAVPPSTLRRLSEDDLLGKMPRESSFLAPRIRAETLFDEDRTTLGAAAFWIPTVVDSRLDTALAIRRWQRHLSIDQPLPVDSPSLVVQLSQLLLFDLLINNSDRFSGGNLLCSPDGRTLYWMDNSFGFDADRAGHPRCVSLLGRCQKFSRELVRSLGRLDLPALRRGLGAGLLDDEAEVAILARRDVALRYVNGLVERHGEERVLVFP